MKKTPDMRIMMTKLTQTLLGTLGLAALIAASAIGFTASAEDKPAMDPSKMDHSKMDHSKMGGAMPGMATAADTPATQAYKAANDKMHGDMAITFSGDADVDFIKGMLPHHKGAVDMANIVLKYGKDPEAKKLAEEIIKAQNSEIAFMTAWLAKKGK